jgi:hypothetical protein
LSIIAIPFRRFRGRKPARSALEHPEVGVVGRHALLAEEVREEVEVAVQLLLELRGVDLEGAVALELDAEQAERRVSLGIADDGGEVDSE